MYVQIIYLNIILISRLPTKSILVTTALVCLSVPIYFFQDREIKVYSLS